MNAAERHLIEFLQAALATSRHFQSFLLHAFQTRVDYGWVVLIAAIGFGCWITYRALRKAKRDVEMPADTELGHVDRGGAIIRSSQPFQMTERFSFTGQLVVNPRTVERNNADTARMELELEDHAERLRVKASMDAFLNREREGADIDS